MAFALRCSLCSNNWPWDQSFQTCPLCEERTTPMQIQRAEDVLTRGQAKELIATTREAQPPDEPTFDSIHPKDVFEHRYGSFMRMGFGPAESEQLAHTRLDTYQAKRMLEQGCAPEMALEILL